MLFVRLFRSDRHGTAPQFLHEFHLGLQLLSRRTSAFQAQPFTIQGANARPHQGIGYPPPFHHVDQAFHETSRFGNHGMKGLVVCW